MRGKKGVPNNKVNNAESDRRTETMVGLLVMGLSRREILQYCSEKADPPWGVSDRQIDTYIKKAYEKIQASSNVNIDKEMGLALRRLEDLYKRNVGTADYKTALLTQRERHELLGLKKQGPTTGDVTIHVRLLPEDEIDPDE